MLNLFHRPTSVTSWIENVGILTEFSERKSVWFMFLCFGKDWIKNNNKVSFFLSFYNSPNLFVVIIGGGSNKRQNCVVCSGFLFITGQEFCL